MARKENDLSNVFSALQSDSDFQEHISQLNPEDDESTPKEDSDLNENIETDDQYNDFDNFKKDILHKYDKKRKRKTMEETHTRTTFLLENSLANRLNKLTRNKRGLKTLVLNDAVRAIIMALEDDKKK